MSTVLVSLVTHDRQFFKAYHGIAGTLLAERGTPRDLSFCRHVVEADRPTALIVPNAFESPLFASHPLVTAGLIGSYVGVPLVSPSGGVLGTLCVLDAGVWLGSAQLIDALRIEAQAIAGLLCRAPLRPRPCVAGRPATGPIPAAPEVRRGARPVVARRPTRPEVLRPSPPPRRF